MASHSFGETYRFVVKGRKFLYFVRASTFIQSGTIESEIFNLLNTVDENTILNTTQHEHRSEACSQALDRLKVIRKNQFATINDNDLSKSYVISLEGTDDCNLSCRYCFRNQSRCHERTKMDVETARRAIDFLIFDYGKGGMKFTINFTSASEPLLNFDLYKYVVGYCKEIEHKHGFIVNCNILTNGTLLTDEMIQWFDKNYQILGFSIDGSPRVHDEMRVFPNGRGSYNVILPRIKKILNMNWAYPLGASAVLTSKHPNVREVFLDLFRMGFRWICIKPVRAEVGADYAINEKNLEQVEDCYSEFVAFLLEKCKSGESEYLLSIINSSDFLGRFLLKLFYQCVHNYRCGAGRNELSVATNGDIYPCPSFISIKKYRLGTIFSGVDPTTQTDFINLRVTEKKSCNSCWARFLCGGSCYYLALLNNGRLDKPDNIECKLTKHVIKLAVYLYSQMLKDKDLMNKIRLHV